MARVRTGTGRMNKLSIGVSNSDGQFIRFGKFNLETVEFIQVLQNEMRRIFHFGCTCQSNFEIYRILKFYLLLNNLFKKFLKSRICKKKIIFNFLMNLKDIFFHFIGKKIAIKIFIFYTNYLFIKKKNFYKFFL